LSEINFVVSCSARGNNAEEARLISVPAMLMSIREFEELGRLLARAGLNFNRERNIFDFP
jgi:hypothetical protein